MPVCSCDSIVIGKHALVFPPAFGIPLSRVDFRFWRLRRLFSLPALSALFAVPEGEHLPDGRVISSRQVLAISLIFDLNDRTTPQSASRPAPQLHISAPLPP